MPKRKITVEIDEIPYRLLQVITCSADAPASVEEVVGPLIDHAQQGVYRPGSWERGWLYQAFGDEWTTHLEPGDPYGRDNCEHTFQRPKKPRSSRRRND